MAESILKYQIKKYANRRLYDVEASRYITLEELRGLIAAGHSVQVTEDKSGDDITRQVLLQIISDAERGGQPLLTNRLLEQLIRFYGNPMQQMAASYLEASMRQFSRQQQDFRQQFERMLKQSPLANLGDAAEHNLAAWQKMQDRFFSSFFGGTGDDKRGDASSGGDGAGGSKKDDNKKDKE